MSVHIRYRKDGMTSITATGKDASIIYAAMSGRTMPAPLVDKVVIEQEAADSGKRDGTT